MLCQNLEGDAAALRERRIGYCARGPGKDAGQAS